MASALAAPFVVSVRDEHGDPFPDMPVLFTVTDGGGAVSATAARADTSGNAATTLTLGREAGMNTVVARAADLEPAVFTARAHGSPDVNGDGQVDFGDFVLFAAEVRNNARATTGMTSAATWTGTGRSGSRTFSSSPGPSANRRRNMSLPLSQNATAATHFTTHPPHLSGSECASRPVASVGASLVGARIVRKRL